MTQKRAEIPAERCLGPANLHPMAQDMGFIGFSRTRKTWLLSSKHCATPVHGLCVVMQLNSIDVNENDLQYHTQPVYRCGAIRVRNPVANVLFWDLKKLRDIV